MFSGKGIRTVAGIIVALIVIVSGGELLWVILVEAADLLLEASQAVLLLVFERGFGLPFARAQGLAAWTSLGLLVLSALFALWKLAPWMKSQVAAGRRSVQMTRERLTAQWQSARWYQKGLTVLLGLLLLAGLTMVI